MNIRDYFTEEDKLRITNAIRVAELKTSGEIRVHIEKICKENELDRAAYIFEKIGMHKTELRNGVLFYVALEDRKFAILGDAGINAKVPAGFWDSTRDIVISKFKEGDFTEGLTQGIIKAGEQLKSHFPRTTDDINEISDDISFGKN